MSTTFTLHIPVDIYSRIRPPNIVYNLDCQATENFVFKRVPELSGSAKSGLTQQLTVTSIIRVNEHATIYRAVSEDQGSFVLKFTFRKGEALNDLENEARNYNTLSVLQGVVIPKFYGCFRTETETRYIRNKRRSVTCIVLEDCGEHLKVDHLMNLDDDLIFYLFEQLGKMHMECHAHPSKISPYKIAERKVDGRIEYRFMDLHNVKYHECHANGQWYGEDGREPEGGIGCALLTAAADDAFFWVKIVTIPSTYIGALAYDPERLPPQFFIDKVIPPNAPCAVGHSMLSHVFAKFFSDVYKDHQQQIEPKRKSMSNEAVDKYRQLWLEKGLPTTATEAVKMLPDDVQKRIHCLD
ncbi:uncharacterized protein EV420DRAFT_1159926 [Desarmillaria tabescens]|uniref:Protein kinase domain-containing protein n=1 Tax=Armillaria tabescens TaxID=1929756 RepID=A0AA39NCN8_ARMTA|nr:uncharacterized protein EV420DRAFT_1159926 [Desarmillaria tabescens]KAK0463187.1 hypothetical protein EV420DRAFT_1159926 [Desarmillaria tabescens]